MSAGWKFAAGSEPTINKRQSFFFTATAFAAERAAGLAAGADDYLVKPNDFDRLAETIKRLVQKI